MEFHELADLLDRQAASGRRYLEFVRVPALSAGLYVLPAGDTDPQQPHAEDEVYHVLEGEARITVGEETRDVLPGSTVFVAARVPHRFHDIRTDLKVLVFFGPAETPPG
jgi:mannose-6-phosphate isomerase-like protein (cupin superfamily)